MFALGASVDRIASLGMKNIEQHALELNRFLTSRLIDSGWRVLSPIADERMRSAETLVEVEDPAAVVAKLAGRKIIVTKKPQGIRIATHFFNNEEDIDRLMKALSRNSSPQLK